MSNTSASKLESQHQKAIPASMAVDLDMDEISVMFAQMVVPCRCMALSSPLLCRGMPPRVQQQMLRVPCQFRFMALEPISLSNAFLEEGNAMVIPFFVFWKAACPSTRFKAALCPTIFWCKCTRPFQKREQIGCLILVWKRFPLHQQVYLCAGDTDELDLQVLVSGLSFWSLASSEYVCLDLPFLPPPQIQH